MKARIFVDTLADPRDEPERVRLGINYGEKVARLDLPVPKSLFDREPGIDA